MGLFGVKLNPISAVTLITAVGIGNFLSLFVISEFDSLFEDCEVGGCMVKC